MNPILPRGPLKFNAAEVGAPPSPEKPATPGLRPMEERDVAGVKKLLDTYLEKYNLAPNMSEEEVKHWLLNGILTMQVVILH